VIFVRAHFECTSNFYLRTLDKRVFKFGAEAGAVGRYKVAEKLSTIVRDDFDPAAPSCTLITLKNLFFARKLALLSN